MNENQVKSVARDLLQIAGTFVTTYGVMSAGQWEIAAGAVLMLVPVVWGMLVHTDKATIETAAQLPAVDKVVVGSRELANEIPSSKVISERIAR